MITGFMKIKTKNRIKAVFVRVGDLFVIAIIFFIFYLAVGTYGQVKFKQGYNQGFFEGLNNAKKPPAIKTTLPTGVMKAQVFENLRVGH